MPAPDDWAPLDPADHARQAAALRLLLRRAGARRAVDVGCGDGRVAREVAPALDAILCLDNDPAALHALSRGAPANIVPRLADVLDPAADLRLPDGAPADVAWCLGHTFMLFHDPDAAASLLRRLAGALRPGSPIAIDNFPGPLWAEVAAGRWVGGVSPGRAAQIAWAPGDNVFALRFGADVAPRESAVRAGDRLHRLWSMGELRLLALAAGVTGPTPDPTGALLLFVTA